MLLPSAGCFTILQTEELTFQYIQFLCYFTFYIFLQYLEEIQSNAKHINPSICICVVSVCVCVWNKKEKSDAFLINILKLLKLSQKASLNVNIFSLN